MRIVKVNNSKLKYYHSTVLVILAAAFGKIELIFVAA